MAKLNQRQKRFITIALACYDTPSQVADAVKEEFRIEIGRQAVSSYDPTTVQGSKLSKELRALFETTRKTFTSEIDKIPASQQAYRLRRLQTMLVKAEARNNLVLAASILEQIAKEIGGAYTNIRKLAGGGPGTFPIGYAEAPAGLEHFYGNPAAAAAPTPTK